MVLEIDDSVMSCVSLDEASVLSCICNILLGYYEGNYLVYASDDICDFFMEKIKDDKYKSVLNYIKNHNCE